MSLILDITGEQVLRDNGFHRWTTALKEFIQEEFNITATTTGYNHRSVQFQCSYEGLILEVDLLVSPFWDIMCSRDFYSFLQRIPKEKRKM